MNFFDIFYRLIKRPMTLIQQFEGCKLEAYKCPAGVYTIGYGNTTYENGNKVKQGDKISQQRAEELYRYFHNKFEKQVLALVQSEINANQKDALTSFSYNVGIGNFKRSTLLKKVNANPQDTSIRNEFMKWTKANGKVLNGLVKRREAEAIIYFKK